jgi:prepilin-type processing-associated H-X9-DG protein
MTKAFTGNDTSGMKFSFRLGYFTRPAQVPYQFCSTHRNDNTLGSGSDRYANPYQAESWHQRSRPTVFLDGHVKSLVEMKYRFCGLGATLAMGPHNTYDIEEGTTYAGGPPHNPWDFWLDEY